MSLKMCDKIMAEYLSGNWQEFFKIWNVSFPLDFKESSEYKIMTLNLRVHYAILPIRIVHLHQNINSVSMCSNKVSEILDNFADKYLTNDNRKEFHEEQGRIVIDSMKQLEYFIKSSEGQKLVEELKDSSFQTVLALPYILNPQEDKSVSQIFSIDWLEKLTVDLEKFVQNFFLTEIFFYKELEDFQHYLSLDENLFKEISMIKALPLMKTFLDLNKFTKYNNELLFKDQIIKSIVKKKEIEDWIMLYQKKMKDNNLCTRSTQTDISSINSDIAIVTELNHESNTVPANNLITNNRILHNDEVDSIKSRLLNLHKHYEKLKSRFHKLHDDYLKMNEVAEILTISLENSVQGQPVYLNMILQSCLKIFPNKFSSDTQTNSDMETSNDSNDLSKKSCPNENKENIVNDIPLPPKLLDYKKIKLHLKFGDMHLKLLLLQALRQKLTLTQSEHRDDIIYEYTVEDLLGLQENILDTYDNNILLYLLQPLHEKTPVSVMQQTTSRFLNALASLSCGRIYLSSSPIVLNTIILYLDSCNSVSDSITLDMLLATLQKMSLRKQERNYMIEANLVEWLIHHLNTENLKMRTYRLEYACALLMNLSLHSSARSKASVIATLLVSTMISLLSTDCLLILPYVNGALQNFLLNNEINEEAKKFSLTEILEYHCIESDDELRNNFIHTLKIHERECNESLSDDDEFPDEDDDIFNILEKELDEEDPLKVSEGELQGENLLETCYSISNVSKNIVNSVPVTSIDNILTKQSKKVELNISKIINGNESRINDSKTNDTMQKRCKEEFNSKQKTLGTGKGGLEFKGKEKEEDAFLAKPKIMRTPPASAEKRIN